MNEELFNINDAISSWHDSADMGYEPLHKFLGMSWKDYARWVELDLSAEELAAYGFYDA